MNPVITGNCWFVTPKGKYRIMNKLSFKKGKYYYFCEKYENEEVVNILEIAKDDLLSQMNKGQLVLI